MPKVLLCASTAVHISNFHLPYLAYFKEQGFEVHVAVPGGGTYDDAGVVHDVPITKRLLSIKNIAAALQIRRLVRSGGFDLILVHTTLAAFVTRLGVLLAGKIKPPLINTVHGYFFWKGCGLIRKLMYYLPERLLRSVTDGVITMNAEDTEAASRLVKKGGIVKKVHGMGVNGTRFSPPEAAARRQARQELQINNEAFVLVYPAEFSKRKNHMELLQALDEVRRQAPEVLLLLCGTGTLEEKLRREIRERSLQDHVRFLGWCSRMEAVYAACDLAVSASRSEGLPFNIVEAQLCALPVVASRIRGHTDLIRDGKTGWRYAVGDAHQLSEAVLGVIHSPDKGRSIGKEARQSALQFTLDVAFDENIEAYRLVLDR
jgi:glycosyltransferase EpsD